MYELPKFGDSRDTDEKWQNMMKSLRHMQSVTRTRNLDIKTMFKKFKPADQEEIDLFEKRG